MKRIMWIEYKGEGELSGPVRIGWVKVKLKGKRVDYKDQQFATLNGHGFKSNFFDVKTGEHYWISGCRKDGRNALYTTTVEIDEDALKEYWINIRNKPEKIATTQFRADGKYQK